MPLEIAAIATSVVSSFLIPLVKKGAQQISETIKEKVSAAAGEHVSKVARNIWEKVKGAFSSDTEKATLAQFEKYPEASKPLVEAVLTEKMQADGKLAEELDRLVRSPSPDGAGTAVQISASTVGYVDARGATISGGTVAGVIMGAPAPSPVNKPPPGTT
jgi:hypothetical protein